MLRNIALALGVVVPVLAAGCTDVDPEISFASQRVDWEETLVAFAESSTGPRTLLINGLMLTPNECYSLRASQQIRSGSYILTITATLATNQCNPGPGAYTYQYLASALDPGTSQLQVIHVISGGASQVILEEEIVID